jgi:hypothetical protein
MNVATGAVILLLTSLRYPFRPNSLAAKDPSGIVQSHFDSYLASVSGTCIISCVVAHEEFLIFPRLLMSLSFQRF